jgi:hypothetical protein
MNNKPVAWMERKINLLTGESIYSFKKAQPEIGDIPLYTHPVKELTDEEIMECERWVFLQERMRATNDSWNFTIELARAILRKAQEK